MIVPPQLGVMRVLQKKKMRFRINSTWLLILGSPIYQLCPSKQAGSPCLYPIYKTGVTAFLWQVLVKDETVDPQM